MGCDLHIKIAPSILSADFGRLGEQVAEASRGGADYIHVDVMDGHFVPNLTIGPPVVRAIKRWSQVPLDVHLMVSEPRLFLHQLADAGADIITVHAEACADLGEVIRKVRNVGVKVGVAISPGTPTSAVEAALSELDLVLVMTVDPGFGGQSFIWHTVRKIERIRSLLDAGRLPAELEVDGGISPRTAKTVVEAGARVLVAGSAVYKSEVGVAAAIARLRGSVGSAG